MKKRIELDKGLLMEVKILQSEIKMGIGLLAESNIFVAQGNANSNLKVKLVLKPKE